MAFLDEVMTEQIRAEARQIEFRAVCRRVGLALLAAIGWLLFGAGWTVRKTFIVAWRAATWSAVAVKVGWQSAGPRKT